MICFAICFYIGISNFSAIQRYRDIHEFRKTDPDDKAIRIAKIKNRIFDDDTDAVTTEKASNINVNHLSTFDNFSSKPIIRKSSAIQRYRDLHEFRETGMMKDKIPRANNIQKNNIDDTGLKKTPTSDKAMTSSSWNYIRFSGGPEIRYIKY